MQKYIATFCFLLVACFVMAVPAKKGIWKTLPLNGIPVTAQLMGDEHFHFWQTTDGRCLSEAEGLFQPADMEQLRATAMARRMQADAHRQRRVRHNAIGDFTHYTGQKKGLIILVEFTNMQFLASNDSVRFTRICNEVGYSEGQFCGSVYDYFKDQSYGQFELTFDVVGPVQMDTTYQYYGQDIGKEGDDARPGLMVATACQAVDPFVDFNDYDWDGDGEVDQVMCIYAGQGQADGGNRYTIWPHEWVLSESDWGSTLTLDDCIINTYAVANERSGAGIEGIGTICHEFSHCLGLPDMYDINYGGNYGMGDWSIMDSGSYSGNGFCPSGYSSFDKFTCGWVTPTVLERNVKIEGMHPLTDSPEVYMVRNDAYENEYYLIENRQKKGWDTYLSGNGLLILYVDYDRTIWENNLVNTNMSENNIYNLPANDHQRCTPFHANNSTSTWGASGAAYPYQGNDSLTNTSKPAATLYHENSTGSKLMNKGILDIQRVGDGTMNFRFRNSPEEIYLPEGTLFYEGFSLCKGRGGNDDKWDTTIASSLFMPDNEGWDAVKAYGGYQCARFGNGSTAGKATTPAFSMTLADNEDAASGEYGEALLSFRAAGWNKDGTTLTLSIEGDGWVNPAELTMESFLWNEYTVHMGGTGKLRVTFSPEKRFLLDDVLVVKVAIDSTSIVSRPSLDNVPSQPAGYYTLDGRYASNNAATLHAGLYMYIANKNNRHARKVVIR